MILLALSEYFIDDPDFEHDATHFEVHGASKTFEKKEIALKKRGSKSKEGHTTWIA